MNHIMVTGGNLSFNYEKQFHAQLDQITEFDRNDNLGIVYFGDEENALGDLIYHWSRKYDVPFFAIQTTDNIEQWNLSLLLVIVDDKNTTISEDLELYCLNNNITIHTIEVSAAKENEALLAEKEALEAKLAKISQPEPMVITSTYIPCSLVDDTTDSIPDEVKQNIIEAELEETKQNIQATQQSVDEINRQMQEYVRNLFDRQAKQYEKDYHRPVLMPSKK